MFSDGQKIFAILFILVFIGVIGFQFYKDRQRNKDLFKGTYWVLITIVGVILAYITYVRLIN